MTSSPMQNHLTFNSHENFSKPPRAYRLAGTRCLCGICAGSATHAQWPLNPATAQNAWECRNQTYWILGFRWFKNLKVTDVTTNLFIRTYYMNFDRLCCLMVRVLGYRSGGPGSIPGTTKKKVVGLERSPLSLVITTEELLGRKVAAPV
jgi:hypothetical protein